MRHIFARVLTIAACAGLLSSPAFMAPLAADHVDGGPGQARHATKGPDTQGPRVLEEYKGLTPAVWLAVWWQEVFALAVEDGHHPLIDGGAFGGNNGIVFLGGPVVPAGSPRVTLKVTVPAGTHLFVPIITVECSEAEAPPFHGEDETELRTCANGLLDEVTDLDVRIDGRRLTNPSAHRVESPLFRYGPLPANNLPGLPPGTQSDALAAGYAMLLPPFSVGVHRIDVHATVTGVPIGVDAELVITVEPKRK